MNLTDSSNDDVTTALVSPATLILARIGALKPMDDSSRLKYKKWKFTFLKNFASKQKQIIFYLSEMVFSKSINAPPHIKRIFFVSICQFTSQINNIAAKSAKIGKTISICIASRKELVAKVI